MLALYARGTGDPQRHAAGVAFPADVSTKVL